MDTPTKGRLQVDGWLYAIYLDGVGREGRTPAQERWLHDYLYDEEDSTGEVPTNPQPRAESAVETPWTSPSSK